MFLPSGSEYFCPVCKEGRLVFRDYCRRRVLNDDGEAKIYEIPRHQCSNPGCRKVHRMLPDFMVPHKHYAEAVISDAVNDRHPLALSSDGPSLITISRWKRWIKLNRTDIDGYLKSVGHRELGFTEGLLRSGVSLLEKLMCSIPHGWLRTILCMIYNSGGSMTPVCRLRVLPTLIFMSAGDAVSSP